MLQVYKELLVEHHKIIPPQYVSKVVCEREREREREKERETETETETERER